MKATVAMLLILLAAATFAVGPPAAGGQQPPSPPAGVEPKGSTDRPDDVKALATLVRAFTEAYNKGDAKAVADLFTANAELTEETGDTVQGREAVTGLFAAAFKEEPGATIELVPESLRFLGLDAARETGRSRTTPAG